MPSLEPCNLASVAKNVQKLAQKKRSCHSVYMYTVSYLKAIQDSVLWVSIFQARKNPHQEESNVMHSLQEV